MQNNRSWYDYAEITHGHNLRPGYRIYITMGAHAVLCSSESPVDVVVDASRSDGDADQW